MCHSISRILNNISKKNEIEEPLSFVKKYFAPVLIINEIGKDIE